MSFKITEKKTADQIFYYVSENMSEGSFHNAGNWNTSNSDNINCTTTRVRPCKITVPEGSTLNDVLGSKQMIRFWISQKDISLRLNS